jgi:hypothetical protein
LPHCGAAGVTNPPEQKETAVTRPQRPVSKETQAAIAAGVDESAEWAQTHGYPESAQELRNRAAKYRSDTGQTATGQQQDGGQASG